MDDNIIGQSSQDKVNYDSPKEKVNNEIAMQKYNRQNSPNQIETMSPTA
jgi:hypothetical protein